MVDSVTILLYCLTNRLNIITSLLLCQNKIDQTKKKRCCEMLLISALRFRCWRIETDLIESPLKLQHFSFDWLHHEIMRVTGDRSHLTKWHCPWWGNAAHIWTSFAPSLPPGFTNSHLKPLLPSTAPSLSFLLSLALTQWAISVVGGFYLCGQAGSRHGEGRFAPENYVLTGASETYNQKACSQTPKQDLKPEYA